MTSDSPAALEHEERLGVLSGHEAFVVPAAVLVLVGGDPADALLAVLAAPGPPIYACHGSALDEVEVALDALQDARQLGLLFATETQLGQDALPRRKTSSRVIARGSGVFSVSAIVRGPFLEWRLGAA